MTHALSKDFAMQLGNPAALDQRTAVPGLRVESITDEKVLGWVEKGAEPLVQSGLVVRLDGQHYATFHPAYLWQDSGDSKGRRFEVLLPTCGATHSATRRCSAI